MTDLYSEKPLASPCNCGSRANHKISSGITVEFIWLGKRGTPEE